MRTEHFKIMLVLLALQFVLAAGAQRPAYYKMSGLVREASLEARTSPLIKKSPTSNRPVITAFVKLTDGDADALSDNGCKILTHCGNIYIAEVPLTAIDALSLNKHVQRIEAGRRATAMMDTTGIIVNAVPVQEGVNLPQGYTGEGVVVGVQDIGFDLTHPNFWSADMSRYRIKAMWDQISNDTLNSTLPVGRDYVGQEELLAVQHPRDGLTQTHGTHTTGIAAGSGAEGNGVVSPYRGIAYDADICLVCNATSDDADLIDPKDYYKYTYALDALGFKYIFDYADRVGKPCVINFSEGSQMDFRGDDQLYYEMLDSLTGPGHIIVASAGNSALHITRFEKPADESTASIYCYKGDNRTIAMTTRSKGNFTFGIKLYRGSSEMRTDIALTKVLGTTDSTYTDSIEGNGFKTIINATAYKSCFDPTDIICDWQIVRDTTNFDVDKRWDLALDLTGEGAIDLFPISGTLYHEHWVVNEGENFYSVNSPGSAPSVICVGSTDYRQSFVNYLGETGTYPNFSYGKRTDFSSMGPTFDERIKPDVMAPGLNIVSSYSSFGNWGHNGSGSSNVRYFTYNGREYYWNSDAGTSMSSPVVAGVIALWLQACPTLTPADCIDIFSKSCYHNDETLSYPNNIYGYGQIDAAAGMRYVLEKAANGIKDIQYNAGKDDRIYSIDGRYMGKETARLPHGIYIRDGKKFIK